MTRELRWAFAIFCIICAFAWAALGYRITRDNWPSAMVCFAVAEAHLLFCWRHLRHSEGQ